MCKNNKFKENDVDKTCNKNMRLRYAQKDADSKPEGMQLLWRLVHEVGIACKKLIRLAWCTQVKITRAEETDSALFA
jgi:hypothetical protein